MLQITCDYSGCYGKKTKVTNADEWWEISFAKIKISAGGEIRIVQLLGKSPNPQALHACCASHAIETIAMAADELDLDAREVAAQPALQPVAPLETPEL